MSAPAKPSERETVRAPRAVIAAERAVLGAMLIDDGAAHAGMALSPADFYREDHRLIFKCAVEVMDRDGTIDLLTLTEAVKATSKLGDLGDSGENGGPTYLLNLVKNVSTAAHQQHYVALVREASLDRQVDIQLQTTAADKTPANLARLHEIMMDLYGVRQRAVLDFEKDLPTIIDDIIAPKKPILDTGFPSLDRILGGLNAGDVTTIGARPGDGKTATMVKMCVLIAEGQKRRALYCTTEMNEPEIVGRVLPMATQIPAWKFRRRDFKDEDYKKITEVCAERLSKMPIRVFCKPTLSLADIRAAVARSKPDVVFVDYLQRCELPKGDVYAYRVREFMRNLKTFAAETKINVVIACQVNRQIDKSITREPEMSDLMDGGAIESESAQVILQWRPTDKVIAKESIDIPQGQQLIRAKVAKNRHGLAYKRVDFFLNGPLIDMCERFNEKPDPQETPELWNDKL